MKLLVKNYKKNFIKAKIESMDDLWYLTYIFEKGDILKSLTYRKIKLGKEDERNSKIIKKPVVISIRVENFEFSKFSNVLRVSGTITEAPEDIPLGSHHTITLEETSEFSLEKHNFLKYQIEKLQEAEEELSHNVLICVHDREEAFFALLKKYGFEILSTIKENVQKKADVKAETCDFFPLLKKNIVEYDKRYNFSNIVIASPGFWREYIQKIITDSAMKSKIIYATCSSVSINGINEVIKRPEVLQALKQEKFAKEMDKVERLLQEIATQGKAEYGLKEVKKAVSSGAASELLITDSFIQKKRQKDMFGEIELLMKKVESTGGSVSIISSEHEGGKKLDGLGGIAAFLRYKLSY